MANFSSRIADAASRWPDRVAIELVRASGVETTTYRALMAQAADRAADLRRAGVRPGDRVTIQAPNDAAWAAQYLAILQHGAVVVPLDTAYSAAAVDTVVRDAGAWRGSEVFANPRGNGPAESGGPLPPEFANTSDPLAVLLYTSGTTAVPKGVALTHANLEAEHAAVLSLVEAHAEDAVLGVLPLFHALAQVANLLLPLSIGARVVFLEHVSSAALLDALQTRGITIFACVPQFFYLIHERVTADVARRGAAARAAVRTLIGTNAWLRDHLGWNPGTRLFRRVHHALGPSMRVLITGGSRFDPAIARDLYGLGFTVRNAYGLTETTGAASLVRARDRFTTSVGHPLPGVEIRIAPATSDPLSNEILIRGPVVMRGYYGRDEATAEAVDGDGWLHTGDLGRLDADGRLYITGRRKEIIVLASGKNLYPEEIEAHYRQSPFIKDLCVLGLSRPGEPAAERLHAVIVPDEAALRERGAVNVRELVRFELEGLAVQLPAHKRILGYDIVFDPLPRTTTGKLRRHEIERHARTRAAAATAEARPITDADRVWLARPDVARLMAVLRPRQRQHPAEIAPSSNLELDLGLDSMERVELLTSLERTQGTQVPADVRAMIFTVRQLIDAVITAPAGAAAPATSSPAPGGLADDAWPGILAGEADPALVRELAKAKWIRAAVLYALLRIALTIARVLVKFRALDRGRVPARGPLLVCANHQSYLDGFFVAASLPFDAFRRVFFVGASEYFATPLTARLARAINIVPVDPDANLISAMRAGAAGLRAGKVLMLFPEGERSIDGEVRTFRKGVAILAAQCGVPIVPVAVDGLYALWPRGRPIAWRSLWPGRAAPVTVAFGAATVLADRVYTNGAAALQSAVAALLTGVRSARGTRSS